MHNSVMLTAPQGAERIAVSRPLSLMRGIASHLAAAYAVLSERRELADLDDRMLADIGLNRHDVKKEIAKSFWDLP